MAASSATPISPSVAGVSGRARTTPAASARASASADAGHTRTVGSSGTGPPDRRTRCTSAPSPTSRRAMARPTAPAPTTTTRSPVTGAVVRGASAPRRVAATTPRRPARSRATAISATGSAVTPEADAHAIPGRADITGANTSTPAEGSCTQRMPGTAANRASSPPASSWASHTTPSTGGGRPAGPGPGATAGTGVPPPRRTASTAHAGARGATATAIAGRPTGGVARAAVATVTRPPRPGSHGCGPLVAEGAEHGPVGRARPPDALDAGAPVGAHGVRDARGDVDDVAGLELVARAVGEVVDRAAPGQDHDRVLGAGMGVGTVALAGLHAHVVHVGDLGADAGPDDEAGVRRDHRGVQARLVAGVDAEAHQAADQPS